MKHVLILLLLVVNVGASPYFKLIDPAHPQIGAGLLISPKNLSQTMAVTDIAIITHSTADGTIIPENWQSIIPPEAWVPLQISFGGSMSGDATLAPGMSANLSPIIAANLLRGVDQSSNKVAQAIKTALTGQGPGQLRLGAALAGVVIRDGHFQSLRAAFPGQTVADIIGNAARINVGYAWRF